MPLTDIGSADASDLANAETAYSVDPQTTEGPSDSKETFYLNEKWTQQFGYYKKIPELNNAINIISTWTVGKGYTADAFTELILDRVKGFGKDTFNTILENMIRVYHIGGDSFAEIILDDDGYLINLKPLDPSVMRVIVNSKGIIIRYEQISKIYKKAIKTFVPEKIFHLSRNRVADEIHGVSAVDAVEDIILARNEAMADMKKLMHRHVIPRFKYSLDTDNAAEIATFKAKEDAANAAGENIYIPKGAVEQELISVPPNATLNPLAWIDVLGNFFYTAIGIPEIVAGSGKQLTEAASKIKYLAWQQTVEEEQLYNEEQALHQLNLKIQLTFPASLENEALSEKPKEEEMPEAPTPPAAAPPEIDQTQAVQPNDTQAGMAGRT